MRRRELESHKVFDERTNSLVIRENNDHVDIIQTSSSSFVTVRRKTRAGNSLNSSLWARAPNPFLWRLTFLIHPQQHESFKWNLVKQMRSSKSTNFISQNDKFFHLSLLLGSRLALHEKLRLYHYRWMLAEPKESSKTSNEQERVKQGGKYQITYSVIQYWSIFIKKETSHESGKTSSSSFALCRKKNSIQQSFPHFPKKTIWLVSWWAGAMLRWKNFSQLKRYHNFFTLKLQLTPTRLSQLSANVYTFFLLQKV